MTESGKENNMSTIVNLDKKVQEFISSNRTDNMNNMMIGLTSIGSVSVNLVFLIFLYLLGDFTQFLSVALGLGATASIIQTIKYLSSRERPENQVVTASFSSSFPSGHSASAFSFATLLSAFYPALISISFTTASLVAFSRIYLGEHFLSDALAGSLIGITVGLLIHTAI